MTAAPLRVAAVTLMLACAACSSAGTPRASDSHKPKFPTVPPVSPCPSPPSTGAAFPPGPPSDVPHPAFATAPSYQPVSVKGVKLLRFTTAMPLRDAVQFVLDHYPQAGYVIGEGDSERDEADVPFTASGLHGTTRLSETGPCTTTWLVATVQHPGTALSSVPQLEPHDTDSAEPSSSGADG